MRASRKPCAARQWDRGRQAVSKFIGAVTMKIAVKERRSNIAALFERLKSVSQRRRVDETKGFQLHHV